MSLLNSQFLASCISLKARCRPTNITGKDKKIQFLLNVNVENKINTFLLVLVRLGFNLQVSLGLLGGACGKEPACQCRRCKRWVWPLGWEDPLEQEMTTYSSILAWRIPWTEEPGGLRSIALQRVRNNWSDLVHACAHAHTHTHVSQDENIILFLIWLT